MATSFENIYQQYLDYSMIPLGPCSKPKKPMSRLSLVIKKLLDPETRVLIKAGVLDNELEVKDEQFVLQFLVNKYKKELALEAKKKLKEEEE